MLARSATTRRANGAKARGASGQGMYPACRLSPLDCMTWKRHEERQHVLSMP